MGVKMYLGCGMGAKFLKTGRNGDGETQRRKLLHAAHNLTVPSSLGD